MNPIPTIPGWNGIHPVMVQFAVALLFASPLLLFVSLFARRAWRAWAGASLLMMALGTLAAWIAVGSGHAAGQLVDKTPALAAAIAQHELYGTMTRTVFTILTLVFAALLLLQGAMKTALPAAGRIGLHAAFLVAYLACTAALANTADRGGRLVHEYGLKAMVQPVAQAQAATEAAKP